MWVVRISILVLVTVLAPWAFSAQQISGTVEVQDGAETYMENCSRCHGPDGDFVPGVDLGHGKFRRASTDEELFQVIQAGIPGTAMPEHDILSDYDIRSVITYLHYMAATARSVSAPGNALQGKAIFEGKGKCLDCHRVQDKGSRLGPDLTEIGASRRLIELERSILEPDAEILPTNRFVRVVTSDGTTITGRLLNQDIFSVQLIDSKEQLRSFQRSSLREFSFLDKSTMPSYTGKLTASELADVVSYLASLKGIVTQ